MTGRRAKASRHAGPSSDHDRAPADGHSFTHPQREARQILEVIAGKWAILILCHLQHGPVRFNALQRELGAGGNGVSQKVLAQQLRRLERHRLVRRIVHPTPPPSVEYSLTPAARELCPALSLICQWAERHMTAGAHHDDDGRAPR